MATTLCEAFVLFVGLFQCLRTTNSEIVSCSKNETCGFNSKCIDNKCHCDEGFQSLVEPVGKEGKNCIDTLCATDGKCYTCIDKEKCKRCIDFVMKETGKCSDTCTTGYTLRETSGEYLGKVCNAPSKSKFTEAEFIGLIVGLCLAAVLLIVIGVVIYFVRRKKTDEATRRQIEEIKKEKKRKKEERRRKREREKNDAKDVEKNDEKNDDKSSKVKQSGKPDDGNVRGAMDFEL